MITIDKGSVNKIGFSLVELSICDEPREYRIDFISENSKDVKYSVTKIPINLGDRLQVFEIDEPAEIDFALTGYYSYEVYQTTSDNLVEVGLLRVTGPGEEIQKIITSKNPQVYGR